MFRPWLTCVAAALLLTGPTSGARAEYPDRMLRFVVTTAPGTSGDIIARLLTPRLSERFKQTIIVENKPGANGNLAAGEVARSEPNGYTVLVVPSGTLVANLFLYPKSSSSALATLSPVTRLVTNDFVLASGPSINAASLAAFLATSRASPGKVSIATSSLGSYPNLAAEMFRQFAKLDVLVVKHNGEAAAAGAVAGGHVDAVLAASAALASFVSAGKLTPLATTGSKRSDLLSQVPTLAEGGVEGYAIGGFIAIAVPKETPLDIQDKLRQSLAAVSAEPDIAERLRAMHFTPISDTREAIEAYIASERERLGSVIAKMGGALE
jgi:tripartite-type tricarboxylate transporter receptor subunit TctC